jgi:hypothetical protein
MNKLKSLIAATTLIAALNSQVHSQKLCYQTPIKINVTADRLDKAILALSSQTECNIAFDKKVVQNYRSKALKGELTPSDALIALVKGTGLEVHAGQNNLKVNQEDQLTICIKATTLQETLNQAIKKQKVSKTIANQKINELSEVKVSVVDLAKKQGFISAAEKASYSRTFKEVQELVDKGK